MGGTLHSHHRHRFGAGGKHAFADHVAAAEEPPRRRFDDDHRTVLIDDVNHGSVFVDVNHGSVFVDVNHGSVFVDVNHGSVLVDDFVLLHHQPHDDAAPDRLVDPASDDPIGVVQHQLTGRADDLDHQVSPGGICHDSGVGCR